MMAAAPDKIAGYWEIGLNDALEVVINLGPMELDQNGIGHVVFSPRQARHLAKLLNKHARQSDAARMSGQESLEGRNPDAAEMGRRGGRERARRMTSEQRSESARRAGQASGESRKKTPV
jgi:hypothetical protein